MQNAVSAVGHFLSWATEFSVIGFVIVILFFLKQSDAKASVEELVSFFYPLMNLVLFFTVQLLSSSVLMREARAFFRTTAESPKQTLVYCIS